MTISVTDTTLDMEKKAIERYARRGHRLRFWIAWIYCGIFLVSSAVFYIFWCTDTFNDYVLSQMELRNGTRAFEWWQRPPTTLQLNVYIFNYTNVEEFEAGVASKLRVQELGPYVYREMLSRTNVALNDNGTVTFQNDRFYEWIGGRPANDTVVVPNVPLMFTIAYIRDAGFAMRLFINTILSTLREQPFVNLTSDGFLWGYDTQLFEMAKPLMMLEREITFEKFGLLAVKNGIDVDRITMHTGSRGMETLGVIDRVNGVDNRHVWDDERCDKIEGTDGTVFPPTLIKDTSKPIYVYSKDLCRTLPFHFTEQVTTYGIPSLRYKFAQNVFNFSYEQNECFCPKVHDTRVCPPTGIFNMSVCNDGLPLLSSFPHFYGADESLLEQIDGLNPREEEHESYIDLHSRLAISIAGKSRMQVNLEVRRAVGVPFLGNLKDGTILPLIWLETEEHEVPEQILETLRKGYFTVTNAEMTLQWGSLIAMILSLSAMIACLWKYRAEQHGVLRRDSFDQNNLRELL